MSMSMQCLDQLEPRSHDRIIAHYVRIIAPYVLPICDDQMSRRSGRTNPYQLPLLWALENRC